MSRATGPSTISCPSHQFSPCARLTTDRCLPRSNDRTRSDEGLDGESRYRTRDSPPPAISPIAHYFRNHVHTFKYGVSATG